MFFVCSSNIVKVVLWFFNWQAGEQLMLEKPETREQIEPILESLASQWDQLETTTTEKADKLFENKRAVLYEQSCDDIDGWVTQLESQIIQAETAKDLTSVNLLMQKQSVCITFIPSTEIDFKFVLIFILCFMEGRTLFFIVV